VAQRYTKSREAAEALILLAQVHLANGGRADARRSYGRVIEQYVDSPCLLHAVKGVYDLALNDPARGWDPHAAAVESRDVFRKQKDSKPLQQAVQWLCISMEQQQKKHELLELCLALLNEAPEDSQLQQWVAGRLAKLAP